MNQTHHLPTGTLHLDIRRSELPVGDLFAVGARLNPKRAFLFVSKLLGKHHPCTPQQMAQAYARLAAKLPAFSGCPVLFVGMAETATALAQGVFEQWLAQHPQARALYLHSSRLRVAGADICRFEEQHSHAARQFLHLPQCPVYRDLLVQAQALVLIDDEISTGRTFVNLAAALRPHMPQLREVHWLSLTDFGDDKTAAPAVCRHSLLAGSWRFEPHGGIAADPSAPAQAAEGRDPEIADSGWGRLGSDRILRLPDDFVRRFSGSLKAGERVLVLGTGEFIHPAAVFARALAESSGAEVCLQSSTRSPAQVWGALAHKRPFADPYDEGVPYYLYNLPEPHSYRRLFICHEHPANPALIECAAALQAELVQLPAPL